MLEAKHFKVFQEEKFFIETKEMREAGTSLNESIEACLKAFDLSLKK